MTIKLLGGPDSHHGKLSKVRRSDLAFTAPGGTYFRTGRLTKENYPIFEFISSGLPQERRQELIDEAMKPCKRQP